MTAAHDPDRERLELAPIGRVESSLTDPASAPKQGDEGAPEAWLAFEPAVLDALEGIRAGTRSSSSPGFTAPAATSYGSIPAATEAILALKTGCRRIRVRARR